MAPLPATRNDTLAQELGTPVHDELLQDMAWEFIEANEFDVAHGDPDEDDDYTVNSRKKVQRQKLLTTLTTPKS